MSNDMIGYLITGTKETLYTCSNFLNIDIWDWFFTAVCSDF